MNRSVLVAILSPCALVSERALALDFNPIGLWRTVYSESSAPVLPGDPSDRKYLYQPDFGTFPTLDLTYKTHQGHYPPARADALTEHHSFLSSQAFSAQASGSIFAGALLTQLASAYSASTAILGFTIAHPTPYTVRGHIALDAASLPPDVSTADAYAYLYRLGDTQAEFQFYDHIELTSQVLALQYSGILQPGEYRFAVSYFVGERILGPGSHTATGAYDAVLTIPAPPMLACGAFTLLARRRR